MITWYPPRSWKIPSLVSSRSLACRACSSGPWQAKQLSERMGRISRLKSTGFSLATVAPLWAGDVGALLAAPSRGIAWLGLGEVGAPLAAPPCRVAWLGLGEVGAPLAAPPCGVVWPGLGE